MKVIKIGKKDYVVNYTINSLVEMEQYIEAPFTSLFGDDAGVAVQDLRTIIFYGLKGTIHKFTHEDAGELMDEAIAEGMTFMDLTAKFLAELTAALGIEQEEDDEEEVPNE